MLLQKATPEMIKSWKALYEEYMPKLYPNRIGAKEIIDYLRETYPLIEVDNEKREQAIIDDVLMNPCYMEKLPHDEHPVAKVFTVANRDKGCALYETQDEIFQGMSITVGVEMKTGHFIVEGSSYLWDEIFAYRGLDDKDLCNYYLVAEYIMCLRRFHALDRVLNRS